jgi:hypothetical protein
MMMKCAYGLTPPIRPVSYIEDSYDAYIFESSGKYYFWSPEIEDLQFIHDTQSDETALKARTSRVVYTSLEGYDDGYEKLGELEDKQRVLIGCYST